MYFLITSILPLLEAIIERALPNELKWPVSGQNLGPSFGPQFPRQKSIIQVGSKFSVIFHIYVARAPGFCLKIGAGRVGPEPQVEK